MFTKSPSKPSPPLPDFQGNPDPSLFTEYLSTRSLAKRIQTLSPPTTPSTPVYTIKSRPNAHTRPNTELHFGDSLTSPLVAVTRLHIKNHDFGIAKIENLDPHSLPKGGRGEELMTWETLRQITKWSYKVFSFEWGIGKERKSYTWIRKKETWPNIMKEFELTVGDRKEAENGGEVLAVWRRGDSVWNLKKGSFFVKKRGYNSEEERRWEAVVLITFLAILDSGERGGGG